MGSDGLTDGTKPLKPIKASSLPLSFSTQKRQEETDTEQSELQTNRHQ